MKKTSVKSTTKPVEKLSDKEKVLKVFKGSKCEESGKGFNICVKSGKEMKPLHFGFAKNEDDAWKKAAHQLI
jgi:hypothetical protein